VNRALTGRLRVRLHSRERLAQDLQQRSSRWFYASLHAELTRVLTRFAVAEDQDFIIDKLVIDVGEIPLSRFEQTLNERVIPRLQAALHQCRWERDAQGFLRGSVAASDGHYATPPMSGREPRDALRMTSAGGVVPSDADVVREDFSSWRAAEHQEAAPRAARFIELLRYLDCGRIADARPWLSREARDAWLIDALPYGEPPSATPPRVALALRLLQSRCWQRLVTTWSPSALARLSLWLADAPRLPSPPQADVAHFAPLAALLALQHQPQTWTDPAVSRALDDVPSRVRLGRPPQFALHRPPHPRATQQRAASPSEEDSALRAWLAALVASPLPVPLKAVIQVWLQSLPADEADVLHGPDAPPRPLAAVVQLASAKARATRSPPDPATPHSANGNAVRLPGPAAQPDGPGGNDARRVNHAGRVTIDPLVPHVVNSEGVRGTVSPARLTPAAPRSPLMEEETAWGVAGAGLVLLWPLLPAWFESHGWLREGQFTDEAARWQAMAALDWLAWGDSDLAEWRSPCARLLCGIEPDAPFVATLPDTAQQDQIDAWLPPVLRALPSLNRCSVPMLRELFLQRPGTLRIEGGVKLTVEPQAADVLLGDLPWPLTPVVVPWLPLPLTVDWKI